MGCDVIHCAHRHSQESAVRRGLGHGSRSGRRRFQTIRHIRIALCVLVALIFCSAASGQTDTARKEALDVRISLAQRAFHLGEPIQLRLEISNIGHEALLVPNSVSLFGNSDAFLEIELRSRKGLVSPRMGMAVDCFPTPAKNKRPPSEIVLTSFLLLRPGTSYVQNIPLYEYAIKPGSYTLRTYYASNGLFYPSMCGTLATQGLTEEDVKSLPFQAWHGKVSSNETSFTILPATKTQ